VELWTGWDLDAVRDRAGIPLCPQPGVDQGDPFLVAAPAPAPFRHYVYVTGPGFPAYGSDDLLDWEPLGPSHAETDPGGWCWAPSVHFVPELARPWVMLYSRAAGTGPVDGHRGHRIRRADSRTAAGPFVDSGEVLTPHLDFAIDPEVYRDPDGTLWLAYATDFVTDRPLGTGLARARLSPDLRRLDGPAETLARAGADWQLYDPARSAPWKDIPGVDWAAGDTVRWYCLEGPAALTAPTGRELLLYSGGNFADSYGIGILARDARMWTDLSLDPADRLLAGDPAGNLYAPGHCTVLTDSRGESVLCFHFRTAPDRPRQFGIVPLSWDGAGLPYCRLTARGGAGTGGRRGG
jgi:Glycosyl hydrolases family 43